MEMSFAPVSLERSGEYYELWRATPRRSLDYTLTNLWGWQEYYGLEWCFESELCWIRQTRPRLAAWAPLGNWNNADWNSLLTPAGSIQEFIRVPEELANIWISVLNERVESRDERGQWEYLYKREELATLPGNRFHKKRNHFNSYVKTYGEPDYQPINDRVMNEVKAVQDVWCHWHECDDSPSLRAENDAINRVLERWDSFRDLTGGCLYVDEKMVAFSVGEKLDNETLGVHFEKGLNGFKGVYQAMNCEFARNAGKDFKWINRAQDLDEEGLRQAKMTYLPAAFLKKYTVLIKS